MPDPQVSSSQPVQVVETGSDHDDPQAPEQGVALSLSGGGYRAMLFHLGAFCATVFHLPALLIRC